MNYKITDADGKEVPLWMGPFFVNGDENHHPEDPFWADRRAQYRIVVTA